jgi:hypothetical protein
MAGNGTYLVLLRVGFTQLSQSLGILVSSYLTFSPLPTKTEALAGGIFSVALSLPCEIGAKKLIYFVREAG